jgi:hypothetical protein
MADVDVSRVCALSSEAQELLHSGRLALAAEVCATALAAAQALRGAAPDCLLVAYLQLMRADMLHMHAQMLARADADRGLLPSDADVAHRTALRRVAFDELLPPAAAALERRAAAGTLLEGACRPYEEAWFASYLAHLATFGHSAADGEDGVDLSRAARFVGYAAFLRAGRLSLQVLKPPADGATARGDAARSVHFLRMRDALDAIVAPRGDADTWVGAESSLVVAVAQAVDNRWFNAAHEPPACAQMLQAWERLLTSGVLNERPIDAGVESAKAADRDVKAAAAAVAAAGPEAAAAAAAPALRRCALASCGVREAHGGRKHGRCSVCRGVVYCCKAHQVEDWQAHKAACKAARAAMRAAAAQQHQQGAA